MADVGIKLDEIINLLSQILAELKKEGPEEKSRPVGGFRASSDAPF